jgi:hypothetical protein
MDKSQLQLIIAQAREQYIMGAPLHEMELAILDLADQIAFLQLQIAAKETVSTTVETFVSVISLNFCGMI